MSRGGFSDVVTGSPADEADLKVGDEIVEVNGQSLDGASHMEIITFIHKVSILHPSQFVILTSDLLGPL